MPFYGNLQSKKTEPAAAAEAKMRAAQHLRDLKSALVEKLPVKNVDGTLLLATWNIREFGEGKFRGWADERTRLSVAVAAATPGMPAEAGEGESGRSNETGHDAAVPRMKGRLYESLYYMAEIISRFDLVAIQEIRDDLEDLNLLREILGSWWQVLITDVTAGRQGNRERVGFLFDERKVKFGGLAGEVVLPPEEVPVEGTRKKKLVPVFQLARTPYVVGFKAGWFRFTICSTHLYYGESKADDPQRLKEMKQLAAFLKKEVESRTAWAKNVILLGDFNIFSTKDKQFEVLAKTYGFKIPAKLFDSKTNIGRNKPFDQIAFLAPSQEKNLDSSAAGVFPFYDYVFRDNEEATYAPIMGGGYEHDSKGRPRNAQGKKNHYRMWRTFQMSDHNLLWIELKTDFGDWYLSKMAAGLQSDHAGGPLRKARKKKARRTVG